MRVNHAGEIAAQALYHGQALTARNPRVRAALLDAARDETDHLAWCEQRGLYAEVFPTIETLDARIDAHAKELASYSPEAMADLKKVMWRGTENWDVLLTERAAISGRLVLSDFTTKAIAKFREEAAKR